MDSSFAWRPVTNRCQCNRTLQQSEHRLAAGAVPAVATPARRGRDAGVRNRGLAHLCG